MARTHSFLFSGLLLYFLVQLIQFLECLPVSHKEDQHRSIREANNLKEELQRLRQILESEHRRKSQITTTTLSAVDQEYNKLISVIKDSDQDTLKALAKSLNELNSGNGAGSQKGNSVGDYLGKKTDTNSYVHSGSLSQKTDQVLNKSSDGEDSKAQERNKDNAPHNTVKEMDEFNSFRSDVLHALEKRLLKDVSLALKYGFYPKDIIEDLEKQGNTNKLPRSAEGNLEEELTKVIINEKDTQNRDRRNMK